MTPVILLFFFDVVAPIIHIEHFINQYLTESLLHKLNWSNFVCHSNYDNNKNISNDWIAYSRDLRRDERMQVTIKLYTTRVWRTCTTADSRSLSSRRRRRHKTRYPSAKSAFANKIACKLQQISNEHTCPHATFYPRSPPTTVNAMPALILTEICRRVQ